MESIYYILIIIGVSSGLIILYIILRSMKIIGAIPILSDVIDPLLNAPSTMFETYKGKIMYYETKRPKTGYWNPTATEKDMLALWERDGTSLPEEMHKNNSKSWVKFQEKLGTDDIDSADEDRYYDPKTGVLEEYYEISYIDSDDDPVIEDAVTKYNFKTGKVTHEINI